MQRKQSKNMQSRNLRTFTLWNIIIAIIFSCCNSSRESELESDFKNSFEIISRNYDGLEIIQVIDKGQIILTKTRYEHNETYEYFYPSGGRLFTTFELDTISKEFTVNSAPYKLGDYENGKLLRSRYCVSCHSERKISQISIKKELFSHNNFFKATYHKDFEFRYLDSLDIVDIWEADSVLLNTMGY